MYFYFIIFCYKNIYTWKTIQTKMFYSEVDNIVSKNISVQIHEHTAHLRFAFVSIAPSFYPTFSILIILFEWIKSYRLLIINM